MRNILIVALLCLACSCQKEKFTKSGMANDHFFLQSNGANMPVYVRGNLNNEKIVILVHGGPGNSDLQYRVEPNGSEPKINKLEKEFAVVYYDQRGAGASQGNNIDMDVINFKKDLKNLILLLKAKYGNNKKIYVMGHSWGGFVVPYFLEEYQNMVNGWIQVDGAHNYSLNDSLTWRKLSSFGNTQIAANIRASEWQTIVNYCNLNNPLNNKIVGRKLNRYAGDVEAYIPDLPTGSTLAEKLKQLPKSGIPITSYVSNLVANTFITQTDFQAYSIPISENLFKINKPALLLWGKYDFICPSELMNDITSKISSTDVTSKIFNKSGHSPMVDEPELFWQTVVDWVAVH